MSKIFINNFPKSRTNYVAANVSNASDEIEFTLGFDLYTEIEEIKNTALSSFFQSILIHDEIFISYSDYNSLIKYIGVRDVLKLLDAKIIKVIFNNSNICVMNKENPILSRVSVNKDLMEDFENKTHKSNSISAEDKAKLIQFTDNSKIVVCDKDYTDVVFKEISLDIKSSHIIESLGIRTNSVDEIYLPDSMKLLRMSSILNGLVIQSHLNIDCLTQDGYSKNYINAKLGAVAPSHTTDSIECFSNISEKKGIPDLYSLYKRNIMTMDEIIKCRETYSGSIFRKWIESKEYSEQEIIASLLNATTKDKGVIKFIRWLYPNLSGLVNTFFGAGAAAFDSYIVNKIIDGWKPSFFLDDVLKKKMDRNISLHSIAAKRNEILKRFGSVGRNDPCPCQSGKKFKQCHGNF